MLKPELFISCNALSNVLTLSPTLLPIAITISWSAEHPPREHCVNERALNGIAYLEAVFEDLGGLTRSETV